MPRFSLRSNTAVAPNLVAYTDEVMALLVARFPDLADNPVACGVVADSIRTELDRPTGRLEVILDHPIAANWRLKVIHDRPGAFRVADYRLLGTSERPEIDALNVALEEAAKRYSR